MSLEFCAGISLALGVWGEEIHFFKDSDTQGAGFDKARGVVLLPAGFEEATEEEALFVGAGGFLVRVFEDLR